VSVRFTTLPSGLRVVTDAAPHLRTAALGVFVSAGSRHEADDEHGLSHLLEHMAFKGTRRRSAREIAEAIENAGGDLNAETGVEQTAYFARVLGEEVDLALDVLADILTESRFDAEELGRSQCRERHRSRVGRAALQGPFELRRGGDAHPDVVAVSRGRSEAPDAPAPAVLECRAVLPVPVLAQPVPVSAV